MQVSIQLDADGNFQKCCVGAFELSMEKVNRFSCYKTSILQEKKKKSIYAATSSGSRQTFPHFPFDTIVKLNVLNQFVHTWSASRQKFIGEPIFIPKGDEEEGGYLLVVEVRNVLIIYLINNTA